MERRVMLTFVIYMLFHTDKPGNYDTQQIIMPWHFYTNSCYMLRVQIIVQII